MARFIVAALEGDFRERLAEVVRECGRRPAGAVRHFADWASVRPFASRKDYLAAAVSGAWTVLSDDMEMSADVFDKPELGGALAGRYRTRVVGAFADTTTGECGYRVYTPDGVRGVFLTPDGIAEDVGEPLPGEGPVDPEANQPDTVLDALWLIGLDIGDGVEESTRCALVRISPKRGSWPQSRRPAEPGAAPDRGLIG